MKFFNKVIYQIYPKSFLDTNGDGIGDIKGIIKKLDYLKELGIDVIWINPIFVSPQKDNGYDIADYYSIDEKYGTMEEFEELCSKAKNYKIDIMLDMVFNHTSTEHLWFKSAIKGDNYYKDFYIFKKGKNNKPPTNWNSKFGGSAWEYIKEIDEWYLHLFDKTQADLNWDNPNVRNELIKILNFWISKGVNCFRFDVINLIGKEKYVDDPNELDGRQFYTDLPKVHDYLKELNINSFGKLDTSITVGEMSSTNIDNCVYYASNNGKELSMVFTFHHLKVDYKNNDKWELQEFDFAKLKDILNSWQIGMQEHSACNALFWNNHDQPRAISRFGDDINYHYESATMLATAIHMMNGVPYIYQGEEIGMTNAYFDDIKFYQDIESINRYNILKNKGVHHNDIINILRHRSRDNSRTPMQWNMFENAGFTEGIPWISVNKNYKEINVEIDLSKEKSIYKYYKYLINFRKNNKIVQYGKYIPYEIHKNVLSYIRKYNDEEILILCNFYADKININFDFEYKYIFGNYDRIEQSIVYLLPYEVCVLKKVNIK